MPCSGSDAYGGMLCEYLPSSKRREIWSFIRTSERGTVFQRFVHGKNLFNIATIHGAPRNPTGNRNDLRPVNTVTTGSEVVYTTELIGLLVSIYTETVCYEYGNCRQQRKTNRRSHLLSSTSFTRYRPQWRWSVATVS